MKQLSAILTIIGLMCVLALIFTIPTMLLWNWLMPTIFLLPKVTFWQALGINMLCQVLFKNSSHSSSN